MLKFIYILWTLGVLAIFGAVWGYTGKWDSYYSFLLIAWLSFPVGLNCLFLGFTKIKSKGFGFFIGWVFVVGIFFYFSIGLIGIGWNGYYVFSLIAWILAPLGVNFLALGFTKNKRHLILGLLLSIPFVFLACDYFYKEHKESIKTTKKSTCEIIDCTGDPTKPARRLDGQTY